MKKLIIIFLILAIVIFYSCQKVFSDDCMDGLGYIRPYATLVHGNGFEYYYDVVTTKENYDMKPIINWKDTAFQFSDGQGEVCELSNVTYHIQISTSLYFINILEEEENLHQLYYKLKQPMGYDDVYQFRIRYKDENDSISDWSNVFSLRILERTVSVVYPAYGKTITETKPTFEWEIRSDFLAFDKADYSKFVYHFRLFDGCDGNGNFNGVKEEAYVTGLTYYTLETQLKKGEYYYWRVDYVDEYGENGRFNYICYSYFAVN